MMFDFNWWPIIILIDVYLLIIVGIFAWRWRDGSVHLAVPSYKYILLIDIGM